MTDFTPQLNRFHTVLITLMISLWLMLLSPPLLAQDATSAPSIASLEERQKAADGKESLAPELRQSIHDLYAQAIDSLQQLATQQSSYAELQAKVKAGPQQLNTLRRQIVNSQEPADVAKRVPANARLADVEALIFELESDLNSANETRARLGDVVEASGDSSRKLRDQLAEKVDLLNRIRADLDKPKSADAVPEQNDARRAALQARAALRQQEIDLLKLRLDNDTLLGNLAAAERELAMARITRIEPELEFLNDLAQRFRENQATARLTEAEQIRQQFKDFPAPIQEFADHFIELNQELEKLTRLEAKAIDDARTTQLERDNIQVSFDNAKRRVEVVGPTSAIGRMLRKRLKELPSDRDYGRGSSARQQELNRATDRQIDIDEIRLDLSNPAARVEELMQRIGTGELTETQRQDWRQNSTALVEAYKNTLDNLFVTYGNYIAELTALDKAQQQQVAVSDEFTAFIRQTLLKIRSSAPISFHDSLQTTDSLAWAISPSNWMTTLSDLLEGARNQSFFVANAMILFLLLALFRRYSRRRLVELGTLTIKIRTDRFRHTLKALLYTLVVIAAFPVLLATMGWTLISYHNASDFSIAIGQGLELSAVVLFTTDFFRKACRVDGLVDRHFRWPNDVRALLRNEFHWFFPTSFILSFVVAATAGVAQNEHVPVLGRPAFIGLMVALLILTYRIYRKNSPLTLFMQVRRSDHWFTNARIFWWPVMLAIPAALIIASLAGYHYTAVHLSWRLLITHWLLIVTGLMLEILLRWIYVERRRIRFEEALRKREEQGNKDEPAPPVSGEFAIAEEQDIDYNQLSEQAHRLLKTAFLLGTIIGIWYIWADLLPALSFLENINTPLSAIEMVDGIEKQIPITAADIGTGLFIGFLTLFAAKNLPGILEFTLLQRLPLEAGSRYAIVTISQYLIVAFGIFTVFTKIGVDWSSIGWIMAALGVGLGFGLQEIFANFVSGLIILFEQPARVGDVVTVGDLSGSVSRIQIRATTIRDWDRKEIIVPNKNFITERVINWTLTDPITRVVIPVGIAYDSDTELAYEVIKSTAEKNPLVMDEPGLQLFFLGFGDSSLNYELRVFVRQLEDRLAVTHQLHLAIHKALRDHGIEIPFPQRDLHIRSGGEWIGRSRPDGLRKSDDPGDMGATDADPSA